jgi:3D (Asp-Asp-Asp) domain-containing protein
MKWALAALLMVVISLAVLSLAYGDESTRVSAANRVADPGFSEPDLPSSVPGYDSGITPPESATDSPPPSQISKPNKNTVMEEKEPVFLEPTILENVLITEYAPAREEDFTGIKVPLPGLKGRYRVDWAYSARGIMMEGEGIGEDGKLYQLEKGFGGGWLNSKGSPTVPGKDGLWSDGPPAWNSRSPRWISNKGITFPLEQGGWSNDFGSKRGSDLGILFKQVVGEHKLSVNRSIAVDPKVIPLGSMVYIPYYATEENGGWFVAEDVGGAIQGLHIDVYRDKISKNQIPRQTVQVEVRDG